MKVQIVIFKSMSPVVKGLTKILHAMVPSLRAHTVYLPINILKYNNTNYV